MHINSKDLSGAVVLKDAMGQVRVFKTLDDALVFILHNRLTPAAHLPDRVATPDGFTALSRTSAVILRDACGLAIAPNVIDAELERLATAARLVFRKKHLNKYDHDRDFRTRALPYTGKCRWGRFYRSLQTHAERRAHLGLEADLRDLEDFPLRVKIRGRRKNVPTAWDDIRPARRGDGWKNYRKTQFKP